MRGKITLNERGQNAVLAIEAFPSLVRSQLLSMLCLDDLQSMVHASPVFHGEYVMGRQHILISSLKVTLGSNVIDALAVLRSSARDFCFARTSHIVLEFLKVYHQQLCSAQHLGSLEAISMNEAVSMSAFFLSVVNPLLQRFSHWLLDDLANKTKSSPEAHAALRHTEVSRMIRAMYRYQLCSNLFGSGYHSDPQAMWFLIRVPDILDSYMSLLEPWEVEEILCFYSFVEEQYDHIFKEIEWDVNENNPKFEGQRPPTPDGAFDLGNSFTRDGLLTGTSSRGLGLLHKVLVSITNHEDLVSTMQEWICSPPGDFIDSTSSETAQYFRRQNNFNDRDQRQARRDPLPFVGDLEISNTGELHPPLAWTIIWSGTYSNLYGYYIGENIRRWGFVMWDAFRLEQTGARQLLEEHRHNDWYGEDPRDYLL